MPENGKRSEYNERKHIYGENWKEDKMRDTKCEPEKKKYLCAWTAIKQCGTSNEESRRKKKECADIHWDKDIYGWNEIESKIFV